MKDIVIIGGGGFGREVEMLVYQINQLEKRWNLIGFLDDRIIQGTKIGDLEVLGSVELIKNLEDVNFVIAIANAKIKKRILNLVGNKNKAATLIHPSAILGNRVIIGEGSIICAGNIITEDVNIGKHVILNLMCTVGHDTTINDLCSFMPAVNISGEVLIEKGVFVGTGAKIINQIVVGEFSIIGAGAVVTKSIPANSTAVGIPAKPIKLNE